MRTHLAVSACKDVVGRDCSEKGLPKMAQKLAFSAQQNVTATVGKRYASGEPGPGQVTLMIPRAQ